MGSTYYVRRCNSVDDFQCICNVSITIWLQENINVMFHHSHRMLLKTSLIIVFVAITCAELILFAISSRGILKDGEGIAAAISIELDKATT